MKLATTEKKFSVLHSGANFLVEFLITDIKKAHHRKTNLRSVLNLKYIIAVKKFHKENFSY